MPGGFLNVFETLDEAALRILNKETNLDNIYLEQPYTFSGIDRDPRMRVVSSSYIVLIDKNRLNGKLPSNASWFDIHMLEDDSLEQIKFKVGKTLKEHTTDRYKFSILENDILAFDYPLVIIS